MSCMAFIIPGLVALSMRPGGGGAGAWGDRALWALGWVLLGVGLLQAAASIASQFI